VGEEALGVALYCALVAKDFEDGVCLAANHDGDTDSTASIAGQLLGMQLGVAAIPERWLTPLEMRAEITRMADDLVDCRNWDESNADFDQIYTDYPGH
jgi:ADP-ribosylglycohydrolase